MSQALTHFAIGATGMTILVALFPGRVRISRTLILLGGVFALVPDAYKIAPTYVGWLEVIHNSAIGNLFWLHRLADVLDPTDSYLVTAIAVSMWIGVTIAVELLRLLQATFLNRTAERSSCDQLN